MYIVRNCCLPIANLETNLLKPVFYLQKMTNFVKTRTFYKKKTTSFYKKKLNFAYLLKTQTSDMSFYKKKNPFLEIIETPGADNAPQDLEKMKPKHKKL